MAAITLDQFVAAAPAAVWRALTEPELLRRWWAEGDIGAEVGHEFTLDMPGFGPQPCRVLESVAPERFVYTFTSQWTLAWTLRPEGRGTRVFLEHSGFDLDDKRMAAAFERMGPGWRDVVLPRLADAAAAL
ncbi:SRPBCC family protein [Tsukamurella paurometabola]|uniref:Activator of Hsp90 ATPase homolog 1-like protein n=1 Tax=Tsukamurella paurometabola TaxID=2061 RepID=A0A3P8L3H3_TSUPA|nr:SRPBCC domain-containing protein [Tsukamurella paurometabola]MBS4100291.1 SRPBCC domain-containing protein [Tsukamurella paurometabola]UEA82650.1 SRPBCC domain-containing protein [Tsukamurella paurometabola]VDR39715.1 Activator of Hsp90 ATPase homolog 1-like protein [Tsukamurella paurometabola]